MSPEAHDRLVELDAVSREARAFYEHAAAVLPASALRECCLRMARAKAELVALLAVRLASDRRAAAAGRAPARLVERLAPAFARARRDLDDRAPECSARIAWIEAAMLEACAQAARDSADADCRRVMAWALPMLQRCRDELGPAAVPASAPPAAGRPTHH